jgi:hypothetical protein
MLDRHRRTRIRPTLEAAGEHDASWWIVARGPGGTEDGNPRGGRARVAGSLCDAGAEVVRCQPMVRAECTGGGKARVGSGEVVMYG